MKRIFSHILLAGITGIALVSCDKNTEVIDKNVTAPAYAKFNTWQPADTIGKYFIRSVNNTFKIPVGITNVSSKDRTVGFAYTSSTAVQGTQYNAPTSIVIPAGKTMDSLTISGLFTGYPSTSRIDTLRVEIASNSEIPASAYKNRYLVIMRKYCDVTLPGIEGAYTRTFEGTYGPYTSSVINLTSSGATSATGTMTNIYDSGITATGVVFSWADPANFTVTIPEQNTGKVWSGYNVWIRTSSGSGNTFSSCNSTISLKIDLLAKTAGGTLAGYFEQNYVISMSR